MARQIIKQPDGRYAVFSFGTDRWVAWDLTREDYIERRVAEAESEARASAARLLDEIDASGGAAGGLGWTFAEANAVSKRSGGVVLAGPVDEELAGGDS